MPTSKFPADIRDRPARRDAIRRFSLLADAPGNNPVPPLVVSFLAAAAGRSSERAELTNDGVQLFAAAADNKLLSLPHLPFSHADVRCSGDQPASAS